jgi:hypothetical protein
MNDDNIRAELQRLKETLKYETDSGIQLVIQHRIADLERELEKQKEKRK